MAESGSNKSGAVRHDAQSQRALIVEDDPNVNVYLSQVLEDLGFSVVSTDSCKSAFGAMVSRPELAVSIVDLSLPDGNGLELVGELQRLYSDLPIVIVSGYLEKKQVESAQKEEMENRRVAVVQKPYTLETIEDCLRRLGCLE